MRQGKGSMETTSMQIGRFVHESKGHTISYVDPVHLLVKSKSLGEPWWPGKQNDGNISSAGDWGDIGPIICGNELRAGRPCVRAQEPQNSVFMPGTRTRHSLVPKALERITDRGANDSHGGRGEWRLLRTTASALGPRRKDKEGIHDMAVQTDSPRAVVRNMSKERDRHVRNDGVKHLPTHASPMRLEIAELLKGKPCVYLGAGYSNSRQQNAQMERSIITSQVERVIEATHDPPSRPPTAASTGSNLHAPLVARPSSATASRHSDFASQKQPNGASRPKTATTRPLKDVRGAVDALHAPQVFPRPPAGEERAQERRSQQRPHTAWARISDSSREHHRMLSSTARAQAAGEIAKIWHSRPNTMRGPPHKREEELPEGSWADVRDKIGTRRGGTAAVKNWTPFVGGHLVMPKDQVNFDHYAMAAVGERAGGTGRMTALREYRAQYGRMVTIGPTEQEGTHQEGSQKRPVSARPRQTRF